MSVSSVEGAEVCVGARMSGHGGPGVQGPVGAPVGRGGAEEAARGDWH